jgi:hypothetical protein
VTRSNVPPVDSVLARYCLKLRQLPIEWIATHGLKQFCGSIHAADDTAGNITAQVVEMLEIVQREAENWTKQFWIPAFAGMTEHQKS